ncbi:MAG: hypothetical protein OYL92_03865 [Acidobacteriota bacterium]|nr:hypothetical protein [Acidobacteriota bacterium]MDE3264087.1 hypothetical protein [Acidobacteriota bacterium]
MSETSRPSSFAADLTEKTAQDKQAIRDYRQEIQDTAKEEMRELARELGETSMRYAADGLKRIESGMRTDHRSTARMLGMLWLRTALIGFGVFMAIWWGLWAMGRWQQNQIRENIEFLQYLERQIEERNQTLDELSQEVE